MAHRLVVFLLLAGLAAFIPDSGRAAVEKDVVETFSVSGSPVDSVMSGDGNLFFVLTAQGKLFIYEKNGQLKDTMNVGGSPDMVTSSPEGDYIYLTDKESGEVQIVSVDFVQDIKIQGNSFKGPANAPVAMVIFSDFQ